MDEFLKYHKIGSIEFQLYLDTQHIICHMEVCLVLNDENDIHGRTCKKELFIIVVITVWFIASWGAFQV